MSQGNTITSGESFGRRIHQDCAFIPSSIIQEEKCVLASRGDYFVTHSDVGIPFLSSKGDSSKPYPLLWQAPLWVTPHNIDWSKVSPYAAELYRYIDAELKKILDEVGATNQTIEIGERIRDEIFFRALLKTPEELSTYSPTIPYSRKLNAFYSKTLDEAEEGPVQRLITDPLNLDSVDPYNYILADYREEAKKIILLNRRFNLASKSLAEALAKTPPERPVFLESVAKIEVIRDELGLSAGPDLLSDMSAITRTLKSRWRALYAESYLMPSPKNPRTNDGELPEELRPKFSSLFDTKEQADLYQTLLENEDPAKVSQFLERADHFIQQDLKQYLQTLEDKYRGKIDQQLSTVTFENPPNPKEGVFSYSDIDRPPTQDYVIDNSSLLLADMALAELQNTKLYGAQQLITSAVWPNLYTQLLQVEANIESGHSPYLSPGVEKFYPPIQIANDFHTLISGNDRTLGLVNSLQASKPLSWFSSFFHDIFSALSQKIVSPDIKTQYFNQLGLMIQAVLDLLRQKDSTGKNIIEQEALKTLGKEEGANYSSYFQSVLLFLQSVVESLKKEGDNESIYTHETLEGIDQTSVVLTKAIQTLEIPVELETALGKWPDYQSYKKTVVMSDAVGKALFDFIESRAKAEDFYQVVFSQTDPKNLQSLLTDSQLATVDALEDQVREYLRPTQAEIFSERLRYALYLVKYQFENLSLQNYREQDLSLAKRISDDVNQWIIGLDAGWPQPDATSARWKSLFKPDIDLNPNQTLYLFPEDVILLLTNPSAEGIDQTVDQLTSFFIDYDQGYYRYFSPLAFERDEEGRNIKAVRDHTTYHQLLLVLQDIWTSSDDLARGADANDFEKKEYDLRVSQTARLLAYNISHFLSSQPYAPFWTLTFNDSIIGIVPHEILGIDPKVQLDEAEEGEAFVAHIISLNKNDPWNYSDPTSFFKQKTDGYEVGSWAKESLQYALFRPSDFLNFSLEDWQTLDLHLQSLLPKLSDKTRLQFYRICHAIEVMIARPQLHSKIGVVISTLNEILQEENFYSDNLALFGPENAPREGEDFSQHNRKLLYFLDPLLAAKTYERFHAYEAPPSILTLYETQLAPLPAPDPFDFMDWYLESADKDEAAYLVGRLWEETELDYSLDQCQERYRQIQKQIDLISLSNLELIVFLLEVGQYKDSTQTNQLDTVSVAFIESLSPAEVVWVSAFIKQNIAAMRRELKMNQDEVHYEYVRQTDIDRTLFSLRSDKARALLSRVLDRYHLSPLKEDNVQSIFDGLNDYFSNKEIVQVRTRIFEAYKKLDVRTEHPFFTKIEYLYLCVFLSQGNAQELRGRLIQEYPRQFHPSRVDRFLKELRFDELPPVQQANFRRYLSGTAHKDYQDTAHSYVTGGLYHAGVLENKESHFWKWLRDSLTDTSLENELDEDQQKGVILRLDAALSADLGDDQSGLQSELDWPTESVIRNTLEKINAAKPLPQIDFIRKALFEPYNLLDPKEKSLHSHYNPNGYLKAMEGRHLKDIYSPENLLRIAKSKTNVPALMECIYGDLSTDTKAAMVLMSTFLIENANHPTEAEPLLIITFNNPEVIQTVFQGPVYDFLVQATVDLCASGEDASLNLTPEQARQNLDYLKARFGQRILEIPIEDKLKELKSLWTDLSNPRRDFFDLPLKVSEDLTRAEQERSRQLLEQLLTLKEQLNAEAVENDYRHSLVDQIDLLVSVTSDFKNDPNYHPVSANISIDELNKHFIDELWSLPEKSGALFHFSDLFIQSLNDENSIEADLSLQETVQRLSTKNLYRALIVISRIRRDIAVVSDNPNEVWITDSGKKAQLLRLQKLVDNRYQILTDQLENRRELTRTLK